MNSSVMRSSSLAALVRLNALMAEMISLLLGGRVRICMLRRLVISFSNGGTSPDVIR